MSVGKGWKLLHGKSGKLSATKQGFPGTVSLSLCFFFPRMKKGGGVGVEREKHTYVRTRFFFKIMNFRWLRFFFFPGRQDEHRYTFR